MCSTPFDSRASRTNSLNNSISIFRLNPCNPKAYRLCIMRIATSHHWQPTSSCNHSSPGVSYAKDMFGIVDLYCIAFRNVTNGIPERMIRMRHYDDSSQVVGLIDCIFNAHFPFRKILYAQDDKMTSRGRCLYTWD